VIGFGSLCDGRKYHSRRLWRGLAVVVPV